MGGMHTFATAVEALCTSYKKMNPFCIPFAISNMGEARRPGRPLCLGLAPLPACARLHALWVALPAKGVLHGWACPTPALPVPARPWS